MSESSVENRESFGIHPPYQPGAFVHSMANFVSIINRILSDLSPQSYCEIGVEGQIMTGSIISWASAQGHPIYGIDPSIDIKTDYENYIIIRKPSHEGLHDVPECDVYFVDGDHNYYTVKGELERIKHIPASDAMFPLVFLHDVGWPGDRRDTYYLPSHVPDEFRRQSDSALGAEPAVDGLSSFGIAADNPHYVFANDRGGPENGVLTAVEDFVIENPGWDYVAIPGIFGLGILYKRGANQSLSKNIHELKNAVSWLGEEISILEYNRLQILCETYQTHHHFSLTTNELCERKSRVSNLERELIDAYQKIEEFVVRNSELEQAVEKSKDQLNELSFKNAEIMRELSIKCLALDEAHKITENIYVQLNAMTAHCALITGSWSFRIGRIITYPARRMKLLFG